MGIENGSSGPAPGHQNGSNGPAPGHQNGSNRPAPGHQNGSSRPAPGHQNGSGEPAPWQPPAPRLDPDVHAALGELHARVLVLDAEWRRLGEWLSEMRQAGECPPPRRSARSRRYLELSEELDALRARIAAIRARVDPEGQSL